LNSTTPTPTLTRTSSRGSSPTRPTRAISRSSRVKLNDTPTFSRRSSPGCRRECRCRGMPALYSGHARADRRVRAITPVDCETIRIPPLMCKRTIRELVGCGVCVCVCVCESWKGDFVSARRHYVIARRLASAQHDRALIDANVAKLDAATTTTTTTQTVISKQQQNVESSSSCRATTITNKRCVCPRSHPHQIPTSPHPNVSSSSSSSFCVTCDYHHPNVIASRLNRR